MGGMVRAAVAGGEGGEMLQFRDQKKKQTRAWHGYLFRLCMCFLFSLITFILVYILLLGRCFNFSSDGERKTCSSVTKDETVTCKLNTS